MKVEHEDGNAPDVLHDGDVPCALAIEWFDGLPSVVQDVVDNHLPRNEVET